MSRQPPRKVRQSDRLTRENYAHKTAELYDNIAEWYVDSFWNDETDSDWITLCLSMLEGKRTVVDIGSGPGNFARFFVDAGYDVTCTDISTEMVRAATSRLPGITGIVSDMRNMPFDNNRFDCVFCAYSINHVIREDFPATLDEFGRILGPGGVLCLMAKTGSDTYEFSNSGNPQSRGIMCLFSSDEVISAVQAIGITLTLVRFKNETSAREFQHEKILLVGTKIR
ncbi:MAG: class I SAM-dependent methyltransferase [Pirellulaceae bacterium]